jgi:G3E family GTPase
MAEIHLVTGYLGSGKTQFLSRLLERKMFRERIAVIVNDFGAVMFDGIRLKSVQGMEGLEILDVPGGCLCCSAIEDFREALQSVISRGAQRIFIEATGLADAEQVQRDLAFMRFPIDSTFCVVDALNLHRFRTLFQIVDAQIAAADILLVSKTDLASPDRISTTHQHLDRINPRAVRVVLDNGRIDAEMSVQLFAPQDRFVPHAAQHAQEHLLQENVTAFQIHLPNAVDFATFEYAMTRLPVGIVRMKGVVRFQDAPNNSILLNVVAGARSYMPLEKNLQQQSELFAIGQNVSSEEVLAAFAGMDVRIEAGTVRSVGFMEVHHSEHHHPDSMRGIR